MPFFSKAQIVSATAMGVAHGMNDAQKSMGIIALALAGATTAHQFDPLPAWLDFLRIAENPVGGFAIPGWVKGVSALTMAAGTAGGGWRIIKTLGHKMVKLHPINGFAAEASSALVILTASLFGIPVSTTHNVSASIMGVGAAKRFNAIRWSVVGRMVRAWVLTLPVTALLAYALVTLLRLLSKECGRYKLWIARWSYRHGKRLSEGAHGYSMQARREAWPMDESTIAAQRFLPPTLLERIVASGDDLLELVSQRAQLTYHPFQFHRVEELVQAVFAQVQVGRAVQVGDGQKAGALLPVEAQAADRISA